MALDANKLSKVKSIMDGAKTFNQRIANIAKTDPWVEITLGGKTFKLEYSFGAVRRVLQATGLNINAGEVQMDHLSDTDFMCTMLTAGLQTHNPELTEEIVADMMSMKHRLYYSERISTAIRATEPELVDLEELIGNLESATSDVEGDTSRPLPEIEDSPISGQPAE